MSEPIHQALHQAVQQCRDGENPTAVARLPSGWVLLGDTQFLRGYCLLVADPVVTDLHALEPEARLQFLSDMAILGEAIARVTGAARVNYELLGNSAPALHAHLHPRYVDEPDGLRQGPVWFYNDADRRAAPFNAELHRPLMQQIADELEALGAQITRCC